MAGLVERTSALFHFLQGSPSQPTHFISFVRITPLHLVAWAEPWLPTNSNSKPASTNST